MVGAGVGIAAILGTVRFVRGWSLKPMIYGAIFPVFLLTIYAWFDPNLRSVLGLAWDCGAVTTGPVTVPLVLSLGIGIANAAGKRRFLAFWFWRCNNGITFPHLGRVDIGNFCIILNHA